jgi:hypothetical protein
MEFWDLMTLIDYRGRQGLQKISSTGMSVYLNKVVLNECQHQAMNQGSPLAGIGLFKVACTIAAKPKWGAKIRQIQASI